MDDSIFPHNLIAQSQEQPGLLAQFLRDRYGMLSLATTLQEVMELHGVGALLFSAARTAHLGLEQLNALAEFKLVCEREGGKLLRVMCHHGGRRRGKEGSPGSVLEKYSISKGQSALWQREAIPTDEEFGTWVKRHASQGREITQKEWKEFASQHRMPMSGSSSTGPNVIVSALQRLIAKGNRYRCLLVTPDWTPSVPAHRRMEDRVLTSLTLRELASLPVGQLADESAHLHLWVPFEYLFLAKMVLNHWDFKVAGMLVCISRGGAFGPFYRRDTSFLIAGVRGNGHFRINTVSSWCQAATHNGKPDESTIRELITRIGWSPFLHLFGTRKQLGWTVETLC